MLLACRSVERGEALIKDWAEKAATEGRAIITPEIFRMDLSSLQSVREMAERWEARKEPLHALVCNAGIFSMGGGWSATKDGFESHFGSNYLGHFLLTLLLLPSLNRAARGEHQHARVVMVSSMLHEFGMIHFDDLQLKKGYTSLKAYGQSKLADVMFGYQLEERLQPDVPIHILALHPGNVVTDVVRTLPGMIQWLYRLVMRGILLTPTEGARTTMHCTTSRDFDGPEGAKKAGHYWESDCFNAPTARRSYDRDTARRLWDVSLELVGLPKEFSADGLLK